MPAVIRSLAISTRKPPKASWSSNRNPVEMLGTGLLVFREVLEAALIVSIVCAATRGVRGRGLWVGSGIGAGTLGAIVVAFFASAIASAVSGSGQELFNATILLAAFSMIGW